MKRTKDVYLQYQVESLERRMNLLRDMQMEILDERVPKRVKEVLINQILQDEIRHHKVRIQNNYQK